MPQTGHSGTLSYAGDRSISGAVPARDEGDESKTFAGRRRRSSHPEQLDAGPFEAEVGSFWLHLAAEGKAGRTLDTYTKAVRWFAAAHLVQETDKTRWERVGRQDLQRWTVRLLGEYSAAYAGNQFRAVRRFLRWLAVEEDRPDPVSGLRAPRAEPGPVPVFSSEELSALRRACQGRSFEARRDAAIIEVLLAAGIRLSELAGIRYGPGDPARSDLRLPDREIRVRGKAGRERIVRIGFEAARGLDRYLRARARHPQAARPQLWLGAGGRGAPDPERHLPGRGPDGGESRRGGLPAPVPAPRRDTARVAADLLGSRCITNSLEARPELADLSGHHPFSLAIRLEQVI